jgi:hypothetical protein
VLWIVGFAIGGGDRQTSLKSWLHRWLYVRKCECCKAEIDSSRDKYYTDVLCSHLLCTTCFASCSRDDGVWMHLSRIMKKS